MEYVSGMLLAIFLGLENSCIQCIGYDRMWGFRPCLARRTGLIAGLGFVDRLRGGIVFARDLVLGIVQSPLAGNGISTVRTLSRISAFSLALR